MDGLQGYVPKLTLHKVPGATHWIIHVLPVLIAQYLQDFLTATQ